MQGSSDFSGLWTIEQFNEYQMGQNLYGGN
jgi:hypothetical protein